MISFAIWSIERPTASLAAILAIGKPVALDAKADDRLTLGFISMIINCNDSKYEISIIPKSFECNANSASQFCRVIVRTEIVDTQTLQLPDILALGFLRRSNCGVNESRPLPQRMRRYILLASREWEYIRSAF